MDIYYLYLIECSPLIARHLLIILSLQGHIMHGTSYQSNVANPNQLLCEVSYSKAKHLTTTGLKPNLSHAPLRNSSNTLKVE